MTQEDIDEGEVKKPANDPVARCIRRHVPDRPVYALNQYIRIGRKDYETPTKVLFFIQRFDRGEKVKPITFELDYDK